MSSALSLNSLNYAPQINSILLPKEHRSPLVVDLFAGCGGLALGFEAQGFETQGFEMIPDYADTYNRNLRGSCILAELTTETELPPADVVIGGPPCQPFSVNGHQLGLKDARNGFPIFASAVKRLNPKLWMFENVRGLFYKNRWYLEHIIEQLAGFGYTVECRLLNAVDYGVPQNRERVIVVGHRGRFNFPGVLPYRVTAGVAIADSAHLCPPDSKFLTASMDGYIARYERASKCIRPRDLHLNAPARTITCRNLAGATADMMRIRLANGRRRRLLVREAARLQSFPDWFEFTGGENSAFYQIGNAVAPLFAYHLAVSVRECLDSGECEHGSVGRRPATQLMLIPEPAIE